MSWSTLSLLLHNTAVLRVGDRGSVVSHRAGASPGICEGIHLLLRALPVALPALTLHELVNYSLVIVHTLAHIGVAVRSCSRLGLEGRPVEVLVMAWQRLE